MAGSKRFYVGACLLLIVFLLPGLAGATDETDFQVVTTKDLIDLCRTTPDERLYPHAINFCHGYLVGAFDYHEAAAAGPDGKRLVCPPDPAPSRNEVIGEFIQWAINHPNYWSEAPVETEFRFLMEKWPCNR
jgi:hypothetical protein